MRPVFSRRSAFFKWCSAEKIIIKRATKSNSESTVLGLTVMEGGAGSEGTGCPGGVPTSGAGRTPEPPNPRGGRSRRGGGRDRSGEAGSGAAGAGPGAGRVRAPARSRRRAVPARRVTVGTGQTRPSFGLSPSFSHQQCLPVSSQDLRHCLRCVSPLNDALVQRDTCDRPDVWANFRGRQARSTSTDHNLYWQLDKQRQSDA